MMWKIVWIFSSLLYSASAECGYDCEENSIETSGDGAFPPAPGLPPSTVLGGKVVKLDEIASLIFLNRTKASLNCATGVMQIDLKFEEPFNGIVYADFDRSSSCSILGDGETTAKISLPLTGCGTKQDPVRVFTNNLIVRFHPALEMDGDEIITIVCRYPPPVAPPPPPPAAPLKVTPTDLAVEQPLKGFQILLIICGILFLSLVLFGLSVSYYCLKNQRIRVVRRYPTKDEESLKGSGSSVGTLSMFDTLKIPRAHTLPVAGGAVSSTASETAHGSETLPSDYPSETPSTAHSEAEDIDSRRRSISSGGSFENKAYVPDVSILTQEQLLRRNETEVESHETTTRFRPPPPEPKFDVQMRIKKPPLPPPSPSIASSSSDTDASLLMLQERNLLTIDEREENTMELRERGRAPHTFVYRPEIHSPPKSQSQSPPIYSEVMRRSRDKTVAMPAETWRSEHGIDIVDAYEEDEQHEEEMLESKYAERYYQRALSPIAEDTERARAELTTDVVEPPLVPSRRPEITSHIVDDVFLRTITEKKTIEDIERHRRQVTEYKPQLLPAPKWDVVIRNYPNPNDRDRQSGAGDDTATDWESFSESSSIYGVPPATATLKPDGIMYRSQMDVEKQYSSEIPLPDPPPQNWSTLVSVLNYPDSRPTDDYGEMTTFHRTEKSLSVEDKRKWRKIITTESTLRTLLTEASVREDYERIRTDERYENLFEPDAWDVIIRILSPRSATSDNRLFDQRGGAGGGGGGAGGSSNRYRKKAEWDSRSNRRNSLPTLYEYDSDGSSMRNVNLESYAQSGMDPIMRSRRTSRSSMRSDMDVRSMSEVTVDFARQDVPDNLSETSSYYRVSQRFDDDEEDEDGRSLVRSLSQPSLARSASEFTENWGIRGEKNWDLSSPEHSPRSSIRSKHSGNVDGASSSFSTSLRSRSLYQSRNQWYKETDRDSE